MLSMYTRESDTSISINLFVGSFVCYGWEVKVEDVRHSRADVCSQYSMLPGWWSFYLRHTVRTLSKWYAQRTRFSVYSQLKRKENISRPLEFLTVALLWRFPLWHNLILMKHKRLVRLHPLLALFKSKVYQPDRQVWGIGAPFPQLPNSWRKRYLEAITHTLSLAAL